MKYVMVASLVVGCGDNGGSSASNSNSDSMSGGSATETSSTGEGSMSASMSATDPTEGGMSASGTGTTDEGGSMSDSATMGGGGSGNESASGSTGVDSAGGTGGTSETTTEPMTTTEVPIDCAAAQTKEECLALDCMPVEGHKFGNDGSKICLEAAPSYLGCLPAMLCGQVISYICKGMNVYEVPNSCWPPDYQECEPPTDPNLGFPTCD